MLLRMLPLLSDKFEHHVITLRELGELAPQFVEKGIPVTTIRWNGFLDIAGYRRLFAEVRQLAPDVTITYLFHADMVGRLFLQRSISAPVIPFLRTTYNHPKYLIARLFEMATKHFVPRYLANSEAVKNFYISEIGVPAEKITVIPNGIDTDFFDSIASDPDLRKSLGIIPDDFVIVCVANLHPNKGHKYLLEAFEQIHVSPPIQVGQLQKGLKLLLIGNGTERENLARQVAGYRSKKNITFLGRRTDVPQLLKISDCFVLPTLFEGMSNAIMEAMASGLPVITTDIPENNELIENGKTGILVPMKDSPSLAKAIEDLLDDGQLRKNLGENSKRNISENFDTEIIVSKLTKFLDEL